MAVTRLDITSRQSFAAGIAFGEAGPYERLDGLLHFAVDPTNPANRAIVDLERADRGPDGRVHFQADFCLLRPSDPARGNRRLLLEVPNRGRKLIPGYVHRAAPQPVPTEQIDPGDGLLLRHGWTVAWCGWQWDVIRDPALMGLEAPQARENGRPLEGQVLCQYQPNAPEPHLLLANRVHQPYPAADLDDPTAVLTVREYPDGPRETIPRGRWRFAHDEGGRPMPDDSHIWLEGGFAPGRVYEVVYRPSISPVVGTGLLAVRDCAAFLRYAEAANGNPCGGQIDRTYGFGISQSGRFLRHFLYLGLNLDEAGQSVFDGLIIHVAGERRGEFNQRFGQPSVQSTPGFGHLAPFADDDQTDPLAGKVGGLLQRQRELGGLPRIFSINTSAEYWRGGCSLIHTDLAGERDLEPPAEVRIYHFSGTQHGTGSVPLVNLNPNDGARGAHGFNAVDYSPLLRAAVVNLDRWVSSGQEPPPSAFPRLADETAVPAREVLDVYRRIPGAQVPAPDLLPRLRRYDLGPEADRGLGRWPAGPGEYYGVYVAAVDADGNETAGIRMPDLAVPVATYTGWNPRHPETGGPGQIIPMQGSTFPFAMSAADRQRTADPRPAIEERYHSRDDYLARVRAAAERLVDQRYLLAEDVPVALEIAAERYDTFTTGAVGSATGGVAAG